MHICFRMEPKLILVFLSIFLISNSTLMFGTNNDYNFIIFGYVYMALSSLYLLIKHPCISLKKLQVTALMISIITFTSLLNGDFPLSNFTVIFLIVNALLMTRYISFGEFVIYFDRILYILTVISLIVTALVIVNKSIFSVFPTLVNTQFETYRNIIFCVVTDDSMDVFRNQSLFREPGVFQAYLSLGILFQFFVIEKKVIKKIIIYFIAIATTLSTAGYIAAIVYLVYLLGDSKILRKRSKFIIICAMFVLIAYLFLFTSFLNTEAQGYNVFGKISSFTLIGHYSEIGGAAVARVASVVMNIHIALEHFFIGYGTSNVSASYPQLSFSMYGVILTYSTETLFLQAARYGIVYFLFWVVGYYQLAKKISGKHPFRLLVTIISLFIILITESYIYNVLVYLLMFYGLFDDNVDRRGSLLIDEKS